MSQPKSPIFKQAAAIAAGAAAATLLVPGTAEAQSQDGSGFGIGAFVSLSFGGGRQKATWGWGVEAQAWATPSGDCRSRDVFYGGVARLDFRGNDDPRLMVGALGGILVGELTTAQGTLGFGYRFGAERGTEAIVGLDVQSLFVARGSVDVDILSGRTTFATGFRTPGAGCAGLPTVIAGRALRTTEGGFDLPRLVAFGEGAQPEGDLRGDKRRAVLQAWTQRTRGEWASVPAFLHLAQQLEILGAPLWLIDRALRAADDEARHAFLSAGMLSRFNGRQVVVDEVGSDNRGLMLGGPGLVRLAVESWQDGCIGEGHAAACAWAEHKDVRDPLLAFTQRTIAREELRHAELAWDILRWALNRGGQAVKDALQAIRYQTETATEAPEAEAIDVDVREFGILPATATQQLAQSVRENAQNRLDAMLTESVQTLG